MSTPAPQTNNNFNTPAPKQGNATIAITANGSGNAIQRSGDMSLWDTVANKFVTPESTNVGNGNAIQGSASNVNFPNQ
jgi:hypothetical protein